MIYLDNAATTFPKPETVYGAVEKTMREAGANPGRSGHKMAMEAGRIVYDVRERAAEFLGIKDPMRLIFTANATEGLNLAIKGLLRPGDHAVVSSMEHNSVMRPLSALAEKEISFTLADCGLTGENTLRAVREAIRPETRMVLLNHASNVTGTLISLEGVGALCKEKGILFGVDASQTAGAVPIDAAALGCDFLAAPGHKGLLGPQGTGILYLGARAEALPLKEGGTGSRSEDLIQPLMLPDRYESGTLNTPGIAGLGAGLAFLAEHTAEQIRQHEKSLMALLIEGMKTIKGVTLYGPCDPERQAAVLSFNLEDRSCSEVAFRLDRDFDIYTRSGLHCAPCAHQVIGTLESGTVRMSPGWATTREEIEKAVEAVAAIAGSGTGS